MCIGISGCKINASRNSEMSSHTKYVGHSWIISNAHEYKHSTKDFCHILCSTAICGNTLVFEKNSTAVSEMKL
jgi:hypothetical protein